MDILGVPARRINIHSNDKTWAVVGLSMCWQMTNYTRLQKSNLCTGQSSAKKKKVQHGGLADIPWLAVSSFRKSWLSLPFLIRLFWCV